MNHLAVWIASVWMTHAVCAQWPADWSQSFPPTPHYYYGHGHPVVAIQQKGPVLHRYPDACMFYNDATVSVMRQELKEIARRHADLVAENVRKENDISYLKNQLAKMKKWAEQNMEAVSEASDSIENIQTNVNASSQILATTFENVTMDYVIGVTPRSRACRCETLWQSMNLINQDLAATNAKLSGLTSQFGASISPTSISKMPDSCAELKQLGYTNSGIFFIKGINQVESVYCDFTKQVGAADFQKLIGIVDVKTQRIYFHAQRDSIYSGAGTTVPFNLLRFNEGDAMTTAGIFTAPTPGTYYFALSGISTIGGAARVELHLKTATVDWTSIGRGVGTGADFQTFAIHATLELSEGDQIRAFLFSGTIQDSSTRNTNFVGYLIDEELE